MQQLVLGNWKMNGSKASINALMQTLLQAPDEWLAHAAVIPPFAYLSEVGDAIVGTTLSLGAQNVYPQDAGAYTGEISGPMLKDLGCRYVLIGHSERRTLFHESEEFIRDKFHHVKNHGMIPVLCVGESLEERQQGRMEEVLYRQIQSILATDVNAFSEAIIAYEPIWAIGTGQTATPEMAEQAHAYIRGVVRAVNAAIASKLTILYGGSVNSANAQQLFEMPNVNGGLVGGASLDGKQFLEIVKCISSYC